MENGSKGILDKLSSFLNRIKPSRLILLMGGLLAFGFFFWPTLHRYEVVQEGTWTVLVKINRVTGDTQEFVGGRWISPDGSGEGTEKYKLRANKPQALPSDAARNVSARVNHQPLGTTVSLQIDNKNERWAITQISGTLSFRGPRSLKFQEHRESVTILPNESKMIAVPSPPMRPGSPPWDLVEWEFQKIVGYHR